MDLSFDHGLQRENAQLIWKASINYLQETIKESVEEMSGFMNDKKQEFLGERETSDKEIPDMIMANRLLNKGDRETFIVYLNQEPDMYNLLKEIKDMFGSDICE